MKNKGRKRKVDRLEQAARARESRRGTLTTYGGGFGVYDTRKIQIVDHRGRALARRRGSHNVANAGEDEAPVGSLETAVLEPPRKIKRHGVPETRSMRPPGRPSLPLETLQRSRQVQRRISATAATGALR